MWQAVYTQTFLKELAKLPPEIRQRVERIVFGKEIESDPQLGGRVQQLVGYRGYFKIRVGNYRIGLRIDSEKQTIEFRRVLHRKDIYRRFP